MPYIKQNRYEVAQEFPTNSGELNYAITQLIKNYLGRLGLQYHTINDCLGALEGAKIEFYRRVVVPYEEDKIVENGDVYK